MRSFITHFLLAVLLMFFSFSGFTCNDSHNCAEDPSVKISFKDNLGKDADIEEYCSCDHNIKLNPSLAIKPEISEPLFITCPLQYSELGVIQSSYHPPIHVISQAIA